MADWWSEAPLADAGGGAGPAPAAAPADDSWWKEAPLADSTLRQVGQNIAEVGKGIPQGAAQFAGTAVEGAGGMLLGAGQVGGDLLPEFGDVPNMSREQVNNFRTRVNAAIPPSLRQDWQNAISDVERGADPAEVTKGLTPPPAEGTNAAARTLIGAGQKISEFNPLPARPGYEDSIGRTTGQGLGSVVGGVGLSMAAGPVAAGGAFALSGAGQQVDDAIKHGATVDQLIQSANEGTLVGLTDSAPIEMLTGRIPLPGGFLVKVPATILGKALQAVGKIGIQATAEGIQEGGQQFLQNLVAKQVYDDQRNLGEGIAQNVEGGAGAGGIAEIGKIVIEGLLPGRQHAAITPKPAEPGLPALPPPSTEPGVIQQGDAATAVTAVRGLQDANAGDSAVLPTIQTRMDGIMDQLRTTVDPGQRAELIGLFRGLGAQRTELVNSIASRASVIARADSAAAGLPSNATPVAITEGDLRSPIPTDLIAEGKAIVSQDVRPSAPPAPVPAPVPAVSQPVPAAAAGSVPTVPPVSQPVSQSEQTQNEPDEVLQPDPEFLRRLEQVPEIGGPPPVEPAVNVPPAQAQQIPTEPSPVSQGSAIAAETIPEAAPAAPALEAAPPTTAAAPAAAVPEPAGPRVAPRVEAAAQQIEPAPTEPQSDKKNLYSLMLAISQRKEGREPEIQPTVDAAMTKAAAAYNSGEGIAAAAADLTKIGRQLYESAYHISPDKDSLRSGLEAADRIQLAEMRQSVAQARTQETSNGKEGQQRRQGLLSPPTEVPKIETPPAPSGAGSVSADAKPGKQNWVAKIEYGSGKNKQTASFFVEARGHAAAIAEARTQGTQIAGHNPKLLSVEKTISMEELSAHQTASKATPPASGSGSVSRAPASKAGLERRRAKARKPKEAAFSLRQPTVTATPLTQEGRSARAQIIEATTRLAKTINPNVETRFVESMFGSGPAVQASGAPSTEAVEVGGVAYKAKGLIYLSMAADDAELRVNAAHEAWHTVEDLLSPREVKALRDAFPSSGTRSPAEEVAYAFGDWMGHKDAARFAGEPKRIFARVLLFLRRLRQALRGMGFQTADDIFERAAKGEVAARGEPGMTSINGIDVAGYKQGDPGFAINAWHGTPHEVSQFDASKIGTGEGSQAYGHGLYFAGNRGVAEYYKREITSKQAGGGFGQEFRAPDGSIISGAEFQSRLEKVARRSDFVARLRKAVIDGADLSALREENVSPYAGQQKAWEAGVDFAKGYKNAGNLYQVSLAAHDDEFLDWDKPLSEQSGHVRDALSKAWLAHHEVDAKKTGAAIYSALLRTMSPQEASAQLGSAGIPGIRYLDQGSRAKGEGTSNYVVFDANDVSIQASFALANPRNVAIQGTQANAGIYDWFHDRARRIYYGLDPARQRLQDRFITVRRAQESIAHARGLAELPGNENTYRAEELYHGRTGKRLEDFERKRVEPLIKAITDSGLTPEQVESYLYARHAPERNAQIASINEKMPDGGSGMTNADAADIMQGFKDQGLADKLEGIANRVDAITRDTMEARVKYGLLSPEDAKTWASAYQHYVPLKGFEEDPDASGEGRSSSGRGFDIRGKESRQALGRETRAADLLANVIAAHEETIVRGEKNRVGNTFLRLALDNPNEMWDVNKPKMMRFTDPRTGLVREGIDPTYRLADNVLSVKVAGKPFYITMHDEGMARAMKNVGASGMNSIMRGIFTVQRALAATRTLLSPDFLAANVVKDVQEAVVNVQGTRAKSLTRQMLQGLPAAWRAGWRSARGRETGEMGKLFQEFQEHGGQTGFFGLRTVEDQRNRLQSILKDLNPGPGRRAWMGFRAVGRLIADANHALENGTRFSLYATMRKNGFAADEAASVAKNLTVNFNRRGEWGPTLNLAYMFANAGIQGNARMLQALKSRRVQAAVGGIVALHAMLEVLNGLMSPKDDDGERRYDKLSDFDKDHNLIVVNPYAGEGAGAPQFFKIPLPYGYALFAQLGKMFGEQARAGAGIGPEVSAWKQAAHLAGSAFDTFSPLGGAASNVLSWKGFLNMVAPTLAKPLVSVATNQSEFGRPIYPEQREREQQAGKPMSQTFNRGASRPSRAIAEGLNTLTGGSKAEPGLVDVSPNVLDYFANFVGGGLGGAVKRPVDMLSSALDGDPNAFKWGQVPIARRFVEGEYEGYDRQRYYDIRDAQRHAEQKVRFLIQERAVDEARTARQEMAPELGLGDAFKEADKKLLVLRKQRDAIDVTPNVDSAVKRERVNAIEDRMTDIQRSVVRLYNQRLAAAHAQPQSSISP